MALTEAERMRVLVLLKTLERSRDEREALYHLRDLIDDRLLCIAAVRMREREAGARGLVHGTIGIGGHNYAADWHGGGAGYGTDWLTLERPPPVPPSAEGVVQESAGVQTGGRSNEQAEWDTVFTRALRDWRGF